MVLIALADDATPGVKGMWCELVTCIRPVKCVLPLHVSLEVFLLETSYPSRSSQRRTRAILAVAHQPAGRRQFDASRPANHILRSMLRFSRVVTHPGGHGHVTTGRTR